MIGRVTLEEFLVASEARAIELAPGYVWECVNHLQEYGPDRLPVLARG